MNFYGELPDSYNLVVNTDHPLINQIIEKKNKDLDVELSKIKDEIKPVETDLSAIEKEVKGKKEEEIPVDQKERKSSLEKKIEDLKAKREDILKKYGKDQPLVKQLVDLALLSNNLLKGEELTRFIKRSIELMNK
jgi:molecular chaperone HtpG